MLGWAGAPEVSSAAPWALSSSIWVGRTQKTTAMTKKLALAQQQRDTEFVKPGIGTPAAFLVLHSTCIRDLYGYPGGLPHAPHVHFACVLNAL